jgi:hypothetical protein
MTKYVFNGPEDAKEIGGLVFNKGEPTTVTADVIEAIKNTGANCVQVGEGDYYGSDSRTDTYAGTRTGHAPSLSEPSQGPGPHRTTVPGEATLQSEESQRRDQARLDTAKPLDPTAPKPVPNPPRK